MPWGIYAGLEHEDVPLRVRVRFVQYLAPCIGGPDECWLWPLSSASHGYGQIGWGTNGEDRGLVLAHRLAHLIFLGPIPVGMTVDHRCKVTTCCNPAHLRLRTNVDNARDNKQAMRGPGLRSYKERV